MATMPRMIRELEQSPESGFLRPANHLAGPRSAGIRDEDYPADATTERISV